jgi:hypothetical protein
LIAFNFEPTMVHPIRKVLKIPAITAMFRLSIGQRFPNMSLSKSLPNMREGTVKALLREQRKKAIESCDFPKAKIIDLQLKRLSVGSEESATAKHLLQNQLEYAKIKESVRADAGKAYGAAVEEVYRVESEFQGRVAVLISDHAEELTAHATALAAELELSSIRPVPDSLVLTSSARAVAKIGDFDRAQTMFESSSEVHSQTVAARHAQIREAYENIQKQIDEKHQKDLALNNEKKVAKIQEIVLKYGRVVDRLKKQLANAAFRLQVPQDEVEEAGFFPEIDPNQPLQVPETMVTSPPKSKSSSGSGAGSSRSGSGSPGHSPGRAALTSPRGKLVQQLSPH